MRITIVQTDIRWEDKAENLQRLRGTLETLRGTTDLAVLPEMFSTGFSMNTQSLAEPVTGPTITTLRKYAAETGIALAGSIIAADGGRFYNRAFCLTPEGEAHYYDKRHLFRMGNEDRFFQAGTDKGIFTYRGFRIRLLVCYDLRFPVWSRNVDNEYDLLIYTASWAVARQNVWDTLLRARALENECYVCGVNRVGIDADGKYIGRSIVCSPRADVLASLPDGEEGIATAELDLEGLRLFRKKFPAWADADRFHIE